MFRTIEDFVKSWEVESEFTLSVFSKITDDKLEKKYAENIRSLGRLAWHVTQTLTELTSKLDLTIIDELENKPIPKSISEISERYKKYSQQLIQAIQKEWKDEDLFVIINLYGENWERTRVLSMLINHQIHHRGQMTVIMILLDLSVPGIYGPSKEEWSNYGVEPQE